MASKERIAGAWALSGAVLMISAGGASAGVDRMARIQAQCLSTKSVLRPSPGATLADIQPGGRVELVSVQVCTAERRACFAQGDEVPMSRCLRD
jgi:hypothetical protein